MALELNSPAFQHGGSLPRLFTCDGAGMSPPLTWTGAPKDTLSYALIVEDPDAPKGTFTHWVFFNLAASAHGLPEGVPQGDHPLGVEGGTQGRYDFGGVGYGAPCPPQGETHHYRFTLYALNGLITAPAGGSKQDVIDAMQGHILDQARLVATYQRARVAGSKA